MNINSSTASRHMRTHPALTPASKGWYSIYLNPGGMEGWVDLGDWLHTEMVYQPIHPSTNQGPARSSQSLNWCKCQTFTKLQWQYLVHTIRTTQQVHGQMSSGKDIHSHTLTIAFQQSDDLRTEIKRQPRTTSADSNVNNWYHLANQQRKQSIASVQHRAQSMLSIQHCLLSSSSQHALSKTLHCLKTILIIHF